MEKSYDFKSILFLIEFNKFWISDLKKYLHNNLDSLSNEEIAEISKIKDKLKKDLISLTKGQKEFRNYEPKDFDREFKNYSFQELSFLNDYYINELDLYLRKSISKLTDKEILKIIKIKEGLIFNHLNFSLYLNKN
ncbi:MAG: hypothetical protein ACOYT4_02705 [Nanoarchaeota archaeon]